MVKFVARRGVQAIVAIFFVTLCTYAGLFYFGDPFASSPTEKTVPAETQAVLRAKFGMDRPFFERYLIYLKNLFTGDLGIDFDQRRPVADMLIAVVPNTARLALAAILISTVLVIIAGVAAAIWRDSFRDALITTGAIVLLCIPLFVLAAVLRSQVSGLRTARAKGLPERTVVFKHGVRNAVIPIVNHAGVGLGALMGGAVIVETIFQYNGVGYLFIRAVHASNRPIIMAVAAFATIVFVVLIALVDILCAYLDPRIRLV